MKASAMVLEKFGGPLIEREIEIPTLQRGEILVRIKASGVCGSDVHMWRGEDPRIPLPLILGHEGVGEVVEMSGPAATVQGERLAAGDMILWNRGVSCGHCYYCSVLKEPSLCKTRKVYGIHRSLTEPPFLNGCYSEFIVLSAGTDIFKVGQAVDPAVLVATSCSGATMAHAFDLGAPRPGDTVVIQGPGPLGLFAVAFAQAHGAGQIIVIGGSPERMALCGEFGASLLLDRKKTTGAERREAVLSLTQGRGADLVIEAVGYPEALSEGLELVRTGGTYLSTGYAQPMGKVELDPYRHLVSKNLKLQGVWVSDTAHTYRAMELVLGRQALFSRMITHRFPLREANKALEAMADKTAVKAVLLP
ncbi:5-exo-hydroxycamphor dehydrogenase [Peptococcaceae bacterium CEB3]|nr:5-exo-hydroxycamphor dehydrogenase [Peptococcaceae bacterium CEB3]